jgi:nucleoside-diphosphate-sugar epimerase
VYGELDPNVDDANNPSAASKVGGEALVRSQQLCYGIDATVLRLSNVYCRLDISNRFVPLFVPKAVGGEPLTVFDDHKILDFNYIEHNIGALVRVIEASRKDTGLMFNVGAKQGRSLFELAIHIADATDALVPVDV